ncbi:hypothetical protein ABL78_5717 [Leptomonas seymouri]|uniref:Uncharacterized protein n=1 Tax=Leptomonas seymouri TaxID=5684 RepID=A0A0N1I1W1_LEPSE|nr:hypothetical protein ABL78_5717 [Leptomonas seymouri]|eukprot:KPI85234.1 hypothetical protein ABL78_5717 [Leptomonas seymouri]
MEASMAVELLALKEEQHRLEQLLGHTALGASFEASEILHGNSKAAAQQRCVRELGVAEVNTAMTGSSVAATGDASATEASKAAAHVSGRVPWTYQDRLKELEALKKKYVAYARASMNQYFDSVGNYQGYKERRESRMKNVQPFTFESRELVKTPRIREQRAEDDRRAREAASEERRRHPLKAKPVPPSTFMNKYELMVEEWCQRKAAIELMSSERARLAKEEAEYVRLSAQCLRNTREELMGVVYGPDGKPITKREQRRRALSADARSGCAPHHASEVPLEVKMKLWPALSDHERVRRQRIKYKAAVRKVEVDEEVRQVLPLLTSPTPARCYDAAAGVNAALLLAASGDGGGPCYGVGQPIHLASPATATTAGMQGAAPPVTTAAAVGPVVAAAGAAVAPPTAAPPPLQPPTAANLGLAAPAPTPAAPAPVSVPSPYPTVAAVPPPPPSAAVPSPPLLTAAATSIPASVPVPPPPPGAAASTSLVPNPSLSLFSVSTVIAPPLGVGTGGAASAIPVPPPPPPATAPAPPGAVPAAGLSSPSSVSAPLSIIPSSDASTTSPMPTAKLTALPCSPPRPPLSSLMFPQIPEGASTASAASAPPGAPTATAQSNFLSPPPPPPPSVVPPASQAAVPAATLIASASPVAASPSPAVPAAPAAASVSPSATSPAAAATPAGNEQKDNAAAWRRYNPQLTFKPNVKPGVPNFEALWAKNNAELAEKKKTHPITTPKPFNLKPSVRAERVVGRRPTRSVGAVGPPTRHRSASRTKKPSKAAPVAFPHATASADTTARGRPLPQSCGEDRDRQRLHSNAPRGTRAHALRTEAIYSNYVKQSEEHSKIAEDDEQYWKAVAQRQREVRRRLAGYITDHHLDYELMIKSKVRALHATMKENEKAAKERLADMKRRVAEMPPVFAEPVHLHEESKALAEVEQGILQSLKDTGLDGATIRSILAASASDAENASPGDAADGLNAASAATPGGATVEEGADQTNQASGGTADAPPNTTSAHSKHSHKSSSSSSSNSSSDSSRSSSISDSSSSNSSKKSPSAPRPSISLSVPSAASVSALKPVTPKKNAEYSEDSFEDSSDSD